MSRRTSLLLAAVSWVLTRLLMVWFSLQQHEQWGDVHYYLDGVEKEAVGERALVEYPDATVIPLRVIGWLTEGLDSFTLGVTAFCLLLDATLSVWLALRYNGGANWRDAWWGFSFWILFGMFIGPVMIARLDLLPGVLVAGAAVWIGRNPRIAAAFLGVATAAKLWPLALATGLVGPWRNRGTWARLAWWAGAILILAALTLVTSGWWRVVSPLQYQVDRGLQSETLLATPFIWLATFDTGWSVTYASSKSFEVFGTGVGAALIVAGVASLGCGTRRSGGDRPTLFGTGEPLPVATRAYWLALVLLIGVTSKVFSPQYLLWFGPLIAVMITLDGGRLLRAIGVLMVITAGLTSWFFPLLFDHFIEGPPSLLSVTVLTLRNLLMLVVTVLACRWAWVCLVAEHRAESAGDSPRS